MLPILKKILELSHEQQEIWRARSEAIHDFFFGFAYLDDDEQREATARLHCIEAELARLWVARRRERSVHSP